MKKDYQITILAIDTSCDETSVAVLRNLTVLSNVLPSQMEYHQKYGGVVPSLAKLAHQERIDNVVKEALRKAQLTIDDIDIIAVTVGPGLAIALEVGIRKAKELAEKYGKPLVTVNHMEGHLLSAFARSRKLEAGSRKSNSKHHTSDLLLQTYPALGFLISGNHTEFIVVKNIGDYEKIGETVDDSCGEAYDKCGRILGLGYPAGPIISEFAKFHRKKMTIKLIKHNQSTLIQCINKSTKKVYELPIAMVHSGNLNFSYSGLKTAFKQLVENIVGNKVTHQDEISGNIKGLKKDQLYDLCVTFEAAALSQLTIKLEKAINRLLASSFQLHEVWLGGGVVASARLRSVIRKVCKKYGLILRHPTAKKLTGDNAAMIGVAAYLKVKQFPPEADQPVAESGSADNRLSHDPERGIYLRDFDMIDRDPTLSL